MPTMTCVAEISVGKLPRERTTPGVVIPGATGLWAPQNGHTVPAAISRPHVLQFIMPNSKLQGYTGMNVGLIKATISHFWQVSLVPEDQRLITPGHDIFAECFVQFIKPIIDGTFRWLNP
jgi:hypothetical protein